MSPPRTRSRISTPLRACSSHGGKGLPRLPKPTLRDAKKCFPLDARQWGFNFCGPGADTPCHHMFLFVVPCEKAPLIGVLPLHGPSLEASRSALPIPGARSTSLPEMRRIPPPCSEDPPLSDDSIANDIHFGATTSPHPGRAEACNRCLIRGMFNRCTVPLFFSSIGKSIPFLFSTEHPPT